jgi:seryl-tRNA synthetase
MSQGREEMNKVVMEIVGMMRSTGDSRLTSGLLGGEPHEIMDQINKSMTLIGTCQKELKDLCQQKRAITREGTNAELTQKKLKKMKIILKSIKGQRSMIATLENAMEDHRKKLASVTKTTGDTDDDDNNSSSEEDNESVSKSVNPDDNNESSESE